jgi:hypothetical protein
MTDDGGMNPDVETWDVETWDEARVALGRVATLIQKKLGTYTEPIPGGTVTKEELQEVHNYHLIPEDVRHTLEDLILPQHIDELRVVKRVFEKLAMNHFYLEGGPGGLRMY